MIYTGKPNAIEIYQNTKRKNIDQILAETGATLAINGGLFNGSFKPVCHLKSNGIVYATDPYKYWGYGWNLADIRMTQAYGNLLNYICCTCLVRDGKAETLIYNPDMGGKRPRTALGLFPDGRVWFYAEPTKRTPEQLQQYALGLGLRSAIMLDSGTSTQGVSPSGTYRQGRICQNFILAWFSNTIKCPYPEPTHTVGRWAFLYSADEARWVQWMLTRVGYPLETDGKFGALSDAALRKYQARRGLKQDGLCGSQTREALKFDLSRR